MFDFLISWILTVDQMVGPLPPTPEVAVLVQQLGHDDFFKRQEATEKLRKMGRKAIRTLEYAVQTTKDLEIHHRAENLLCGYSTLPNPLPPIFTLPRNYTLGNLKALELK